jgi:hypothetical protein
MAAQNHDKLEQLVLTRLMRLDATIHGVVFGLISGLAVFVATNWLIIKGGPISEEGYMVVGPTLSLLGQYFIGYSVTFVGSLVGFAYAFVLGFAVGFFIAKIYNAIIDYKEKRQAAG